MLAGLATAKVAAIAGGIALALILALSAALWVQGGRLDNAKQAVALAAQRADTLAEQLAAARTTATGWEAVAIELQLELNTRIEREVVEREAAERAVAEARQIARDADMTLAYWLDRYAEATRDAECAAQLNRPICPAGATP